jgi:D-tyrosyl-tRNA(Tyr) deacylase
VAIFAEACRLTAEGSIQMRAVIQRVLNASVSIDGQVVGQCGQGLLLLVGIHKDDTADEAKRMAEKRSGLRIFNDAEGKMNLSIKDINPIGSILAISNFTVYGDARKQRRPSFMVSASFEPGKVLFDQFLNDLRSECIAVDTGEFGANMQVSLLNDGPVTIVLDIESLKNTG